MKVKFWGTRGSIPVATNAQFCQQKLALVLAQAVKAQLNNENQIGDFIDSLPFVLAGSYGGNTSCVQIVDEQCQSDEFMLCDLGTGIREFALATVAKGKGHKVYHIFMSHLHWDHIMGFPFFSPAYQPGNTIRIYGCHQDMAQTFRRQHRDPNFPVDFNQLAANIEFIVLKPDTDYVINQFRVRAKQQIHKGDSYGYRFEKNGKTVVYSTDGEHDQDDLTGVVEFFSQADVVIFDAMYSLLESMTYKKDWGHSNNLTGVELCQRAGAKQLCLFHHEPNHNDQQIEQSLKEALSYEALTRENDRQLQVIAAYDGLEVEL